MDQNTYLGLMALSEGFGNLSNLGAGRPMSQSQVLPLLMQQKQQEGERARKMEAINALLGQGLGAAPTGGGGQQSGLMLPPGANLPGLRALAEYNPDLVMQGLTEAQFRQPEAVKPPSSVQEFQFARENGFQGSYEDFLQFKGSATRPVTNIKNEGTIPPGYQVERDPTTGEPLRMVPVPGSPDDIARQEAERKRFTESRQMQLARTRLEQKETFLTGEIDKAVESAGRFWNSGAPAAITQNIPGSGAYDLSNTLKTIKANLGFAELQAMRDASPTGGALGNVTERELEYLQSVEGSLDQVQSQEQLISVLSDIKNRKAEFAAERAAIMSMGGSPSAPAGSETRTVGEKTYVKVGGEWFEQ